MSFYADLHIHSRFSRATSRDCTLEALSVHARRKGLSVVATGDFTHPEWQAELVECLVPAEPGLFRLSPDREQTVAERAGFADPAAATPTRFMLEAEIATIYKKGDRTRKVHHLLYAATFKTAETISARLASLGNIASDGRPILGLDSRDLLEIVLESGDDAYLVPAHIWTPWFSVLGSKSGFDSVEECYGDLWTHVFALETGLSSDPAMNARVSRLDAFRFVSNSDAHSPAKLGREACVFDTAQDYFAMRRALETGEGYGGTIEFFPEEGKYHLDGHRKCGVCLEPSETKQRRGLCSACGKPVTVGVLHRLETLADRTREAGATSAPSFRKLVPLAEVLSQLLGVGPQTKTVGQAYDRLLGELGPELFILDRLPADVLTRGGIDGLAEAILRMRAGRVVCEPGYDGRYGIIHLLK